VRYYLSVDQKDPVLVELEQLTTDRYRVTVDGESREVDALMFAGRAMSLLVGSNSYSVELEDSGDQVLVHIEGEAHAVDVVNDRRFRLRGKTAKFLLQGKQVLFAPMPGKITKVLVQLGQQVSEGQGLVVVEAMKMENELKSPKNGKVAELLAVEGSAVEKNAPLVVVD
jgi:biotin carboxyl carrier protein